MKGENCRVESETNQNQNRIDTDQVYLDMVTEQVKEYFPKDISVLDAFHELYGEEDHLSKLAHEISLVACSDTPGLAFSAWLDKLSQDLIDLRAELGQ